MVHRVRYGNTWLRAADDPDAHQSYWRFVRSCMILFDGPKEHAWQLGYTQVDYDRVRPYLDHIVGWEWEPYRDVDRERVGVYIWLDCPVMALLWRLELPHNLGPAYQWEIGE